MSREQKVHRDIHSYYDGTIELMAPKVDMVTECLSVPVKK